MIKVWYLWEGHIPLSRWWWEMRNQKNQAVALKARDFWYDIVLHKLFDAPFVENWSFLNTIHTFCLYFRMLYEVVTLEKVCVCPAKKIVHPHWHHWIKIVLFLALQKFHLLVQKWTMILWNQWQEKSYLTVSFIALKKSSLHFFSFTKLSFFR